MGQEPSGTVQCEVGSILQRDLALMVSSQRPAEGPGTDDQLEPQGHCVLSLLAQSHTGHRPQHDGITGMGLAHITS